MNDALSPDRDKSPRSSLFAQLFPWAVLVLGVAYILSQARPPADEGPMNVHAFGRVPVLFQGRVKPIDTLARNTLMIISDRQTFRDEAGERQPAIRWLLDLIANTDDALGHKVFRIEHEGVLHHLGLEARPGLRYALSEFEAKIPEIGQQAARAHAVDQADRTLFQAKILELATQIQRCNQLRGWQIPHIVPPRDVTEQWQPFPEAFADYKRTGTMHPAAKSIGTMLRTYREGDTLTFNREVATYLSTLQYDMPDVLSKAEFEVFFNNFAPFYQTSVMYVLVFVLGCLGWLVGASASSQSESGVARGLLRGGFWLLAAMFVVHTFALVARMYLQGRPPVTNLYSSAIFIGWGCVGLAMILEAIYRSGIGTVVAAITGFLTLLIAHHLGGDGDTMEMMRAVLDTNFWLATHVTVITLGYTATFVAGVLAIIYILGGLFTTALTSQRSMALARMIYGVICFAMLLSFVGTVLGGIWADQSWGRFWGWDPKENGALMIVIWNALILHARWGGMIARRGMAVLAVVGNIITSWSWFGVNMLGVGLHSYGFMDSAVFWLLVFVASQLVVIGLGLLPLPWWRSFARQEDRPPRLAPGVATATGLILAATAVLAATVA